jgi:hypothetical protein
VEIVFIGWDGLGTARLGNAWQGKAGHGKELLIQPVADSTSLLPGGNTKLNGMEWPGGEGHGAAWLGKARRGAAKQGKARFLIIWRAIMTIKKMAGGMYYANIHHKGEIITFIASTWIGAFKSASMYVFGASK